MSTTTKLSTDSQFKISFYPQFLSSSSVVTDIPPCMDTPPVASILFAVQS